MKVRSIARALLVVGLACPIVFADDKPPSAKPDDSAPTTDDAGPRESKSPRGATVERIVPIKNIDMMRQFRDLAISFGTIANEFRDLGFLVLRGSPEKVASAQAAIAKYDAAPTRRSKPEPKNVEVTAYLVLGGSGTTAGHPVPDLLAPVVGQLQERFPYKQYDLLDTVALRVMGGDPGGSGRVTGILPPLVDGVGDQKTFYTLDLSGVEVEGEPGSANVRLRAVMLSLEIALPVPQGEKQGSQYKNSSIKTGVDIREGQKVVVGKTTLDGTSSSLILVLTVKVV